jgi:hypothetical protein
MVAALRQSAGWLCSGQVFQNMSSPLLFVAEIGCKIIGEEKELENGKHNEQFYGDDLPQGPAHHHGTETVSIQAIELFGQGNHARLPPSEKNVSLTLLYMFALFMVKLFFPAGLTGGAR